MPTNSPLIRAGLRRLLCLLPFLVLLSAARAQQAPAAPPSIITLSPDDQHRGLNGEQSNFYFTLGTSTDYQSAGFFGQRLRPYLAGNQEALAYLNSYRRQKTLLLSERLIFVGAVAAYAQQVLAGDAQQYFNPTQRVLAGVAVTSLLANVFISRNTNHYFQRAVAEHNSGLSLSRGSFLQQISPTTVGLLAPTGRPQLAMRWTLR